MDQHFELVGRLNGLEDFYRSKRWVHIGEYKVTKEYLESNMFTSRFERARKWRRPDPNKGLRDLLFDRGVTEDKAKELSQKADFTDRASDFNIWMAIKQKHM